LDWQQGECTVGLTPRPEYASLGDVQLKRRARFLRRYLALCLVLLLVVVAAWIVSL
jgi:hypothetical protein